MWPWVFGAGDGDHELAKAMTYEVGDIVVILEDVYAFRARDVGVITKIDTDMPPWHLIKVPGREGNGRAEGGWWVETRSFRKMTDEELTELKRAE